jgi:hypothetical protein
MTSRSQQQRFQHSNQNNRHTINRLRPGFALGSSDGDFRGAGAVHVYSSYFIIILLHTLFYLHCSPRAPEYGLGRICGVDICKFQIPLAFFCEAKVPPENIRIPLDINVRGDITAKLGCNYLLSTLPPPPCLLASSPSLISLIMILLPPSPVRLVKNNLRAIDT